MPFVLSLALTVYCLIDAIQTDEAAVRNLPKIAWILLIVLFPIVGPVAWLIAGRPPRRVARPLGGPGRADGGSRPPRGPDDDPDFLRGL